MKKSKAKMMESPQLTVPEGALEDTLWEAPSDMRPDPEVVATASRRQFSNSDKRRILDAADRCAQPGDLGALPLKRGFTPPT